MIECYEYVCKEREFFLRTHKNKREKRKTNMMKKTERRREKKLRSMKFECIMQLYVCIVQYNKRTPANALPFCHSFMFNVQFNSFFFFFIFVRSLKYNLSKTLIISVCLITKR